MAGMGSMAGIAGSIAGGLAGKDEGASVSSGAGPSGNTATTTAGTGDQQMGGNTPGVMGAIMQAISKGIETGFNADAASQANAAQRFRDVQTANALRQQEMSRAVMRGIAGPYSDPALVAAQDAGRSQAAQALADSLLGGMRKQDEYNKEHSNDFLGDLARGVGAVVTGGASEAAMPAIKNATKGK